MLQWTESGIIANTAVIQGISQQVDANSAALQSISQRVDTLANDLHLAMYLMYDEYCHLHRIAERDHAHPSWYTWNPSYSLPESSSGGEVEDEDSDDTFMDD